MPQYTQTEIFIMTLTEVRDEERQQNRDRSHVQAPTHLKLFAKGFRTGFEDIRRFRDWPRLSEPVANRTARHVGRN